MVYLCQKCLSKKKIIFTRKECSGWRKLMAALYKMPICLLFLIISFPVPSAGVTTLPCTSPANTISLAQVSETFKYPSTGSYPRLTTCEWLFHSSDATYSMSFVVSNINVDCGDILRFHDGTSSSASTIGNAICCTGCAVPYRSTTGNNLYGKLSTDNILTAIETGFQVTINVGKDESYCATTGTVKNDPLSDKITLTSPNFPNAYPPSFECTYTYTCSSGTIQIEFLYLDVEPNGSDCYDFVEIYDGNSTSSSVIKRVCGATLPAAKYTSTGSSVTLKFSSDGYSTNFGYKAIISPVETGESTTTATTVNSIVVQTITSTDSTTTQHQVITLDSTTTATTVGSTSDSTTTVVTTETETTTSVHSSTQGSTTVSTPSSTMNTTTQVSTPVSTPSNTSNATTQDSTSGTTILTERKEETTSNYIPTTGGHSSTEKTITTTMFSSINVGHVTAGVIVGTAASAVIVLMVLLIRKNSKKDRVDFENQAPTHEMKMSKYK